MQLSVVLYCEIIIFVIAYLTLSRYTAQIQECYRLYSLLG